MGLGFGLTHAGIKIALRFLASILEKWSGLGSIKAPVHSRRRSRNKVVDPSSPSNAPHSMKNPFF
jgi:hypothetical protein